MSVGNLKDEGNKGNNFPFQLAVLQLLDKIVNATTAATCCPTDAKEVTLTSVLANVTSKIERIKGSSNYTRAFTYDPVGTQNVTVIVHTGTTLLGIEVITETISYVNPAVNGSNVTGIVYS